MKLPIYMDYNATTPIDRRVLEAMIPYLTEHFGHPASRNHSFGWAAEAAVEQAREQVARLINAQTPKHEIIFTSGATESDNLAIRGVAYAYKAKGNHIITQKTENKSVLDTCKALQKEGFEVTYLEVDQYGMVDPEAVRAAITDKTILITIQLANHEIGTIQPIADIAKAAQEKGIILHSNAAQAVGKIPVDVQALGVDLLSISGHKFYGPKGIGALYIRRKRPPLKLSPIITGGGHEKGFRAGTINVAGAVGMGRAAELVLELLPEEAPRIKALRDRLEQGIVSSNEYIHVNGHPERRIPNTTNISFEYIEGESFLMGMKETALSSGSPCTSTTLEPSYVITATGKGPELAHTSVRFSLGRFNTEEEVDFVIERVNQTVKRLREFSPLYEMVKQGIDLSTIQWTES